MLILKLLDPNQKIRLWGRALPWVLMGCVVLVERSFFVELNPMKRNMQLIQVILAHH